MKKASSSIWWFAFGYFACYVPYSALTKALSSGKISSSMRALGGLELLPASVLTSAVAMTLLFTVMKWWRFARHVEIGAFSIPWPTRWTFLSGIATATIVVTTTLAYAFRGVSIPLVMLLMRGGVLLIAPAVDLLAGRRIRGVAWVALGLSLLALVDALFEQLGTGLPILCIVDIAAYLLGYVVRLRFMSHLAKSESRETARGYFVEEQMVATPFAVVVLVALAMAPLGRVSSSLSYGFVHVWSAPFSVMASVLLVGLFSQGTGFFGGLVLLDASENTFCVPLNRASSVLAGLLASLVLALLAGQRMPTVGEWVGSLLLVLAIVVLRFGPANAPSERANPRT